MANQSGGSVVWTLDVDSTKLTQGLSDAKNQAAQTGDQVEKSMDSVKTATKSAGQSFKELADSAVVGSTVIIGALGLISKSAIQLGADYQSARVSFETFLGSGEKAGKLLDELGRFAAKTPFDLPQVVDGTNRLLAYGLAAEEVIPTFRMLGDLSGGQKTKLDSLVLAYGQVRAATKLTGAELRQFTEAGIPMLDLLANELNKNGGAMVKVGGATKKTSVDVEELNDKLAIARKRLEEASKSGKTKESTLMGLRNTIQNYEKKLGDANSTGGKATDVFKKMTVSAGDVKEMISDGAISFDQVNAALKKATGEGGRWFNAMESQSKTFAGVMSNVGDEIKRFTLNALGFFIEGEGAGTVRAGSIFAGLQSGAEGLLKLLQQIRPVATQFIDAFVGNQGAILATVGALLGLMTPLAIAFAAMVAPALVFAGVGAAIAVGIGKVVEAMGGFDAVKNKVVGAIEAIKKSFEGTSQVIDQQLAIWGPIIQGYVDVFAGQFKAFGERMYDSLKLDASKMGVLDFFTQLSTLIMPQMQRFATNLQQGFANAFKFEGGGGGFADFLGNMMGMLKGVSDIVLRILTPAWESLVKAFGESQPQFDYFIQQVGPLLINALKLIAGAVALLIIGFAGIVTAIVQAFSFALPFIVQMMGGIAEVINGAMNIIVGIFTLNLAQIWQGVKDTFSGIYNFLVGMVGTIIGLIAGFIKGIIDFFKNLYDVLVGHSIIPDMVNEIVKWFTDMPGKVFAILSNFMTGVKEWGERIARAFVEGFAKIGDWMKEKVQQALDKAKGALEGHSPPTEGPLQNIDKWGFNVGSAWVEGVRSAIGGFEMPSVSLATSMDSPRDFGSRGDGGNTNNNSQSIIVNIGTVQKMQDVDMIAREIGFRASLLPAT